MIQYLDRQQYVPDTGKARVSPDIKPIHPSSESILQTETFKRDVQEYVSVLEGDI